MITDIKECFQYQNIMLMDIVTIIVIFVMPLISSLHGDLHQVFVDLLIMHACHRYSWPHLVSLLCVLITLKFLVLVIL